MRTKPRHRLACALIASTLVILTAGAAVGQAAKQATRSDTRGGATIKAVFVTPTYFKANPTGALAGKVDLDRNVVFAITLDTHAGDLSKYDFVKKIILRNDRGQRVAPLRWVATADSSHHREGGLVFPKTDGGRARDRQAGQSAGSDRARPGRHSATQTALGAAGRVNPTAPKIRRLSASSSSPNSVIIEGGSKCCQIRGGEVATNERS